MAAITKTNTAKIIKVLVTEDIEGLDSVTLVFDQPSPFKPKHGNARLTFTAQVPGGEGRALAKKHWPKVPVDFARRNRHLYNQQVSGGTE